MHAAHALMPSSQHASLPAATRSANHKSVLGIGAYAQEKGALLRCVDAENVDAWLHSSSSSSTGAAADPTTAAGDSATTYSLLAFAAKDNFEGRLYPLDWIAKVSVRRQWPEGRMHAHGAAQRILHTLTQLLRPAAPCLGTLTGARTVDAAPPLAGDAGRRRVRAHARPQPDGRAGRFCGAVLLQGAGVPDGRGRTRDAQGRGGGAAQGARACCVDGSMHPRACVLPASPEF